MKKIYLCLFLLAISCYNCTLCAQENGSAADLPGTHFSSTDTIDKRVSEKFISSVSSIASHLHNKINKRTRKSLDRLRKQHAAILKKVARQDSLKARQMQFGFQQQYQQLESRLRMLPGTGVVPSVYMPSLDTLTTGLNFLKQNPQFLSAAGEGNKLTAASENLKNLQQGFGRADVVQQFLQERQQYLNDQLGQLGFLKELKSLNKQVYYYKAQINEYKAVLSDYRKAEKKAVNLLRGSKLFKRFLEKNSQLAFLFGVPDAAGQPVSTAALAGLQSRSQINGLIQQQLSAGGPNAQAQFRQNVQDAQGQLNELKDKVMGIMPGNNTGNESILPSGFKPNHQKVKSFWQRIELGTNIQSQKSNGYLPVTTDVGLSIGYKLNDKSILGIGGSYKIGWGESIRKINISHQGMSLRAFADWNLKGSFWISGGYELNYRAGLSGESVTDSMGDIISFQPWQQSGLIGVSKQLSLRNKLFKRTRLQLLWDYLSYSQLPRSPAVVFRVGYMFR